MNNTLNFASGLAIGAIAMYFLDPDRGNRRRKMVADQARRFAHVKAEGWEATVRDSRNRLQGMWHNLASQFSPDDVSDPALTARIRSKMGRHTSHAHAIEVACQDGRVTLAGDILASEVEDLIDCVRSVKGVESLTNNLKVHDEAAGVSSLQGDGRRPNKQLGLRPGPALATGLAGLGLAIYGGTRRDKVGGALGAVGVSLALRGLKDMEGTHKFGKQKQAA